jgi:hypothetical protein
LLLKLDADLVEVGRNLEISACSSIAELGDHRVALGDQSDEALLLGF